MLICMRCMRLNGNCFTLLVLEPEIACGFPASSQRRNLWMTLSMLSSLNLQSQLRCRSRMSLGAQTAPVKGRRLILSLGMFRIRETLIRKSVFNRRGSLKFAEECDTLCLLGAEWFRRNYPSGPWCGDVIFDALNINLGCSRRPNQAGCYGLCNKPRIQDKVLGVAEAMTTT